MPITIYSAYGTRCETPLPGHQGICGRKAHPSGPLRLRLSIPGQARSFGSKEGSPAEAELPSGGGYAGNLPEPYMRPSIASLESPKNQVTTKATTTPRTVPMMPFTKFAVLPPAKPRVAKMPVVGA